MTRCVKCSDRLINSVDPLRAMGLHCFLKPVYLNRPGPHSAVGNVSGNRCKSDCRSRGQEFHPGGVPYFRGD